MRTARPLKVSSSPQQKLSSFEDLMKNGMRQAGEIVAGSVIGWNLDDGFRVDSLVEL